MAKIHYGVKTSRKQGGPKMAKHSPSILLPLKRPFPLSELPHRLWSDHPQRAVRPRLRATATTCVDVGDTGLSPLPRILSACPKIWCFIQDWESDNRDSLSRKIDCSTAVRGWVASALCMNLNSWKSILSCCFSRVLSTQPPKPNMRVGKPTLFPKIWTCGTSVLFGRDRVRPRPT